MEQHAVRRCVIRLDRHSLEQGSHLVSAKADEIGVKGGNAVAHLVKSVFAALLVHLLPGLFLEDAGGSRHLCDNAERILLHVLHHR